MKVKVTELRDMVDARVSVSVNDPVPTLRGPKEVDADDEVVIEIEFGPGASIEATIPAEHYLRIRRAVEDRRREVVA